MFAILAPSGDSGFHVDCDQQTQAEVGSVKLFTRHYLCSFASSLIAAPPF
jgi:hypothetical protein